MIFIIFTSLLLTFSAQIKSATISFTGACSEKPYLSVEINSDTNIITATTDVLNEHDIRFSADHDSLQSMFGLDSSGVMETMQDDPSLGPNQIRFYGWCYEVNGENLTMLPSEYNIQADDHINWFYGYALYDSGDWPVMCAKSHLIAPIFLCGE